MERRLLLAFTTLTIFAPLARAEHPQQAIRPEGTAAPFEFVATNPLSPNSRGLSFARQVLPARAAAAAAASPAAASPRAISRVIYLNHDGVILFPGDNDSSNQRSSIVSRPTAMSPWDVDDDLWAATRDCIADLYSAFDVVVTDKDPGDTPHIQAVIGGHPADLGLPDNVAGVSPFTTDCSVIENSVVFTFTDVMPDDPRMVCEVTAQEIAHSFGLDHELLPSDPMTYLDYTGDRSFQNKMATCGEYEDRQCGINGSVCRQRQNSVALLTERLGPHTTGNAGGDGSGSGSGSNSNPGGSPPDDRNRNNAPAVIGGCTAAGSSAGLAMALACLSVLRRRRA